MGKETPRNTQPEDKQAIKRMLDHQPKPLNKPPQITQRSPRQATTPAPKIQSSILDDAQGSRRRAATPTSTKQRSQQQFLDILDTPTYEQPVRRVSPIAQSRAALHEAHMLRSVPVSFPSHAPSFNLFNGHMWVVALIAVVSIAILMLVSAPARTVISMMTAPGAQITTDNLADAAKALAPLPVAANGEHSILGASTITAEQIDAVLTKYNSPAAGTGKIWLDLGKQYNINPAYALAFFIHESSAGTASGWAGWKPDGSSTHNVGNIICAGYATCYNRFRDYANWDEGIADWYRLIAHEYVEGRGVFTVEQIIPIYAPSFENNVPAYVKAVTDLVQQWHR